MATELANAQAEGLADDVGSHKFWVASEMGSKCVHRWGGSQSVLSADVNHREPVNKTLVVRFHYAKAKNFIAACRATLWTGLGGINCVSFARDSSAAASDPGEVVGSSTARTARTARTADSLYGVTVKVDLARFVEAVPAQ